MHDASDVLALAEHELVVRADGHVAAVVVGADPGAVLRVALGAVARGQAVGAAGGVDLADGGRAAGTGDGLLPEEPLGGGFGGHGPLLGPGVTAVDDGHEGHTTLTDDVLVVPDALDGDLVLALGQLGLIEADGALLEVHGVRLVQTGGSVTAQQRGTAVPHRAVDITQEPAGGRRPAGWYPPPAPWRRRLGPAGCSSWGRRPHLPRWGSGTWGSPRSLRRRFLPVRR